MDSYVTFANRLNSTLPANIDITKNVYTETFDWRDSLGECIFIGTLSDSISGDILSEDADAVNLIEAKPNVIVVAPSEGDYTRPVDALDFITDVSAANPYLVKVMPGVYDILIIKNEISKASP